MRVRRPRIPAIGPGWWAFRWHTARRSSVVVDRQDLSPSPWWRVQWPAHSTCAASAAGSHRRKLEASDRAIFNLLYQLAHDSGELLDPAAEWEIPLATLRQSFSKHESNSRLRDSLERLRAVRANINYLDDHGEPRVILTSLFDFFDIPAREMTQRPTLRFGLPRKMIPFYHGPVCETKPTCPVHVASACQPFLWSARLRVQLLRQRT